NEIPASACRVKSVAGVVASGPSRPYGDTETTTRRGLRDCSSRTSDWTADFSSQITTSIRSARARPAAELQTSVTDPLPAWRYSAYAGESVRRGSPPEDS